MNASAEAHLVQAKEYIAKGDEFYRKAKPEIEAAIASGASQREVARFLARSRKWVQDVIEWDGTGTLYGKDTERRQTDMAKQVLRESTPSQIADIIGSDDRIQSNVEAAVETTYTRRREALRPTDDSGITSEQYAEIRDRMDEIPERYSLVMLDVLTSVSKLKVATVEKVIANATARERREWGERLPEAIALLQLADDLCKARELKAVTNG
jgi:hypothetical protein